MNDADYARMMKFVEWGATGPALYALDEYLIRNPGATVRSTAAELGWSPTRVQNLKSVLRGMVKFGNYPEKTCNTFSHTS